MMNFNLFGVLLCMFSWTSTSVCQFHSVVVQPGGEVTLRCSNLSRVPVFLHWFKLADGPNPTVIVSMSMSGWSGLNKIQLGRFTMTSNITDLFLNIRSVDFSDTGLYFCGTHTAGNPEIFSATHLKVDDVCDEVTNVSTPILSAVTICLVIFIICLAAKIWILQRAQVCTRTQPQNENLSSDDLHYAAPSFHMKAGSNRKPAAERELETTVYTATR
uniref:Ig-like domain-containing protein n=1 Tax=Xiphophorus maculatus TaxID=8083 RepID=M4AB89_XIPMA